MKEKYEIWYKSCEFIRKEMQFYSYEDFKENIEYIKYYYQKMGNIGKELYKWYIFSNVNISFSKKELIWDIINANDND